MKKPMGGFVLPFLWIILGGPVQAQELLEGQPAPNWTLSKPSGEKVVFPRDYSGRPIILLFWATWCPYCAAVMPYLEEIKTDYAKSDVAVLALNFKEDGDPIEHMRRLGFDFELFLNTDDVATSYGARYSPGLFVVDGAGRVIYQRRSTDQKPGKAIAEVWAEQIRRALDTAQNP